MRKTILVFLPIMLFTACASNQGNYLTSAEVENRLRGMPESELAMKLGAPTQKVDLSDGSASWSYRDDVGGITGGECAISVVITNAVITSAVVNARDNSFVSFPLGSCKNLLRTLD